MSPLNRRSALVASLALAAIPSAKAQETATTTQPNASPPRRNGQQPAEVITDSRVETFLLHSSVQDGEPWKIHYAHPTAPEPEHGFPVLYLIDGNATFPLIWQAAESLSKANRGFEIGQVAIVGIGYPSDLRFDTKRRFYDLTPYTTTEYRGARGSDIKTGGQDAFLDFITDDVRRAIASRTRIDSRRQGLFGHSLGGLFTLHALYTRPELFQTYIAADPSIWWNGGSILHEQSGFLAGIRAAGGRLNDPLRLLIENSGGKKPGTVPERTSDVSQTGSSQELSIGRGPDVALDNARKLATIDGLDVLYRRFDNETHGSVIKPASLDALAFFMNLRLEGVQSLRS